MSKVRVQNGRLVLEVNEHSFTYYQQLYRNKPFGARRKGCPFECAKCCSDMDATAAMRRFDGIQA